MSTENFEQFKKSYRDIQPPENLSKHGWDNIAHRLPEQDRPRMPILKYSFMFAGMLLFLAVGLVGASMNAQPGSALYPIRNASEQVTRSFNQTLKDRPDTSPSVIAPKPKKAKPTVTPTPTATLTPTPTKKLTNPTTVPAAEKKMQQLNNKPQSGNSQNNNNNNSNNGNNGNTQKPQPEVAGANTEKKNENNGQKEKQEQKQNNQGNQGNQGNGNSRKN